MTLSEFIKQERGNGKLLAEKLGISQSVLSQIAADSSSTSPARCVLIEQFTNGAVTRRELRPKDWLQIWPELTPSHRTASNNPRQRACDRRS